MNISQFLTKLKTLVYSKNEIDTKLSAVVHTSGAEDISGNKNFIDNLTCSGKNVDVIEEQGDRWIRYNNGLQICWVYVKLENSVYTWSFPKTFSQNPVITTAINYVVSSGFNLCQRCVELNNLSNTGVLLRSANHLFGDTTMTPGFDIVNAIAIGRWKE